MRVVWRSSLYVLVFLCAFALGAWLGPAVVRVDEFFVRFDMKFDPKSAPESERRLLGEILEAGYGSVDRFTSGVLPKSPDYFDRLRVEIAKPSRKSAWLERRLLGELGKSDRFEDAGFLLALALSEDRRWFVRCARRSAEQVARRACEGGLRPDK